MNKKTILFSILMLISFSVMADCDDERDSSDEISHTDNIQESLLSGLDDGQYLYDQSIR